MVAMKSSAAIAGRALLIAVKFEEGPAVAYQRSCGIRSSSEDIFVEAMLQQDDEAIRAEIAAMTPSDEDLEMYSSPPPPEWYREQW